MKTIIDEAKEILSEAAKEESVTSKIEKEYEEEINEAVEEVHNAAIDALCDFIMHGGPNHLEGEDHDDFCFAVFDKVAEKLTGKKLVKKEEL
jgi:hypothetical protein